MRKRFIIYFWMVMAATALWICPAGATEYMVFDKPLTLLGYVTQGAAFGLNDEYDTKKGLQSALMNLFLEGQYRINPQFNLYASGRFSADWAYPINNGQRDWNNRLFDQSSNRMYIDNNYWQILNEAHVTWTPGNFFFRVGKQIVSWGEMDGFRIMDQINPLDSRRGFADVEFENT
ncbi:MAG: hypothetical protein HY879_19730, partial [Deltaproteobacteria bacterium]|nr:hypothetical protein [Deltaproteobacteria bacterium]